MNTQERSSEEQIEYFLDYIFEKIPGQMKRKYGIEDKVQHILLRFRGECGPVLVNGIVPYYYQSDPACECTTCATCELIENLVQAVFVTGEEDEGFLTVGEFLIYQSLEYDSPTDKAYRKNGTRVYIITKDKGYFIKYFIEPKVKKWNGLLQQASAV